MTELSQVIELAAIFGHLKIIDGLCLWGSFEKWNKPGPPTFAATFSRLTLMRWSTFLTCELKGKTQNISATYLKHGFTRVSSVSSSVHAFLFCQELDWGFSGTKILNKKIARNQKSVGAEHWYFKTLLG